MINKYRKKHVPNATDDKKAIKNAIVSFVRDTLRGNSRCDTCKHNGHCLQGFICDVLGIKSIFLGIVTDT